MLVLKCLIEAVEYKYDTLRRLTLKALEIQQFDQKLDCSVEIQKLGPILLDINTTFGNKLEKDTFIGLTFCQSPWSNCEKLRKYTKVKKIDNLDQPLLENYDQTLHMVKCSGLSKASKNFETCLLASAGGLLFLAEHNNSRIFKDYSNYKIPWFLLIKF